MQSLHTINGSLSKSMGLMLDTHPVRLINVVETKRINVGFDLGQQLGPQTHPFGCADLAFKNRFLDAHTVGLADFRHPAQPPRSGLGINRRDIVGDNDKHGSSRLR